MKKIENEKIIINDPQPGRFWVHLKELGYGKWIYNSELQLLIGSKASSFEKGAICVRTNEHALTVGKRYKLIERKDDWVKVLGDNNIESYYPDECFKLDVNVGEDER